jgi:hypothetical protein
VKRLGIVASSVAAWIVVLASQALAQYPPDKEGVPGSPAGPGAEGPAFTGANISLGVIILISLVVVGALLLVAGRRRRAGALQ